MNLADARGDWALVTGASSGIGREFAIQIAAAGVNVVLIARRDQLLRSLASDLSQRYGVMATALPADLTNSSVVPEIRSSLTSQGIKVRLLVNNAALAFWGRFEDTQQAVYEAMLRLNVMTTVSMCHHFIEDLCSFPSSAMINVSSPAGFNPVPYMAVYAATKAFVLSFSQALHGELKSRGVLVQTFVPGPTETELGIAASEYAEFLKDMESPELVVKTSLAHLAGGDPLVVRAKGIFKQRLFAALFPPRIVIKTVGRMFEPSKTK